MDMMWKNFLDDKTYLVVREKTCTDARSLQQCVGLFQKKSMNVEHKAAQ